eukprot:6193697-Karenia_brevis.AAC.1
MCIRDSSSAEDARGSSMSVSAPPEPTGREAAQWRSNNSRERRGGRGGRGRGGRGKKEEN